MKAFFLLLFSILLYTSQNAQSWSWNKAEPQHTGGFTLCKDAFNNVYCYNPLAYVTTQSVTTIKKLDSQGQLVWQLVLPSSMHIKSIACANDGSVYMGGTCWGNFVFNNIAYTGKGKTDIWLAKYNAAHEPI